MLMNPLDMHGPNFLIFYFIAGQLTLFFVKNVIKHQESKWQIPKLNLTDPYEIAFLRGGENEALRISTLSLIDRGLLEVLDNKIKTKNKSVLDNARRSIEKAILKKFLSAGEAQEMYSDNDLKDACKEYQNSLGQNRLLANDSVYKARRPILLFALFILIGLAGAKIFVALQHGRQNILYLIFIAAFYLVYLSNLYKNERTGLGDRVLKDLRTLFKSLNDRSSSIRSGGETNEVALLAAVFGISALSTDSFSHIKKLFPNTESINNSTYTCGSSCGSSCGGGGCGGCGSD